MGLTAAVSEKAWKRQANKRLRRRAAAILQQIPATDPDALVLPKKVEAANPYDSPKEGKMRFDPNRHPAFMRK